MSHNQPQTCHTCQSCVTDLTLGIVFPPPAESHMQTQKPFLTCLVLAWRILVQCFPLLLSLPFPPPPIMPFPPPPIMPFPFLPFPLPPALLSPSPSFPFLLFPLNAEGQVSPVQCGRSTIFHSSSTCFPHESNTHCPCQLLCAPQRIKSTSHPLHNMALTKILPTSGSLAYSCTLSSSMRLP